MSYGGNGNSGGSNTSNTTSSGSYTTSTNYTNDEMSNELPQQKDLYAWYEAKNYDETTGFWKDSSEFGQHILQPDKDIGGFDIPTFFPRKYVKGNVTYVDFTIDTRMVFPRGILSPDRVSNSYTFFHVVRRGSERGSYTHYNNATPPVGRRVDKSGRVFDAKNGNFLSGFYDDREGIYHHVTDAGDINDYNLGTEKNWCISGDTQLKCFSMGYNYVDNKMKRNPENGYQTHTLNSMQTHKYTRIFINYGQSSATQTSDSQVAEIIIYRRLLGEVDILKVLNYLERKYYGTDGTDGVGNLPINIPKCLNPNLNPADNKETLVAWYDGDSFDRNKNCWKDKLGNYHISSNNIRGNIFTRKIITTDTTLISNYNNRKYIGYESPKYIYGNSNSGLRFDPCLIKGNSYTIFNVSRREPKGIDICGRIFDGINIDWYSGFDNSLNGVSNNCITTNLATGGIIKCHKDLSDNNYYVSHTFLTDGTFVPSSNISVDALIIGGGGGGGSGGGVKNKGAGGGGAGGLRYTRNINLTANGIYSITVGEGGRGGAGGTNQTLCGEDGMDSSFNNYISKGGGGGGDGSSVSGATVGSGGGYGGTTSTVIGGTAQSGSISNDTNSNAIGYFANQGGGNNQSLLSGSGGGGSGRIGEDAGGNTYPNGNNRTVKKSGTEAEGGDGGIGKCYNIRTGQYEYYAAGGGGGCAHYRGGRRGYGGLGGGGDGGDEYIHIGKHAINNTGSGGGGASGNREVSKITTNAGNGGNGIVIIRYQVNINSSDVSLNNSGTNYNDGFIISVDRPNYYRSIGYEKTNNTIKDLSYGYVNSTTIDKPHISINYGQKTDISLHAIGGEINTYKKCIKYPETALTSNNSYGVEVNASSNHSSWEPWKAFNHTVSRTDTTWHTSGSNQYNLETGYAGSGSANFENTRGEWLEIRFPNSFKLSYMHLYSRWGGAYVNLYDKRAPRDGIIYGSNNNADWTVIATFENKTYEFMVPTKIDVYCEDTYKDYILQITRINGGGCTNSDGVYFGDGVQIAEMELYSETDETYTTHTFKENGEFRLLNNDISNIDFLVVGGGGGGGMDMGGGGGGGGIVVGTNKDISSNVYQVIVGDSGKGAPRPKSTPKGGIEGRFNNTQSNTHEFPIGGSNGENSYLICTSNDIDTDTITYVGVGGGAGGTSHALGAPWSGGFPGGSGGGKSGYDSQYTSYQSRSLHNNISVQPLYSDVGNVSGHGKTSDNATVKHYSSGGGGSETQGISGNQNTDNYRATGGDGIRNDIIGDFYRWGGGGGGGGYTKYGGNGGQGGGGASGPTTPSANTDEVFQTFGGYGLNRGKSPGMNELVITNHTNSYGGDGGKNTGGGGGGGMHYNRNNNGGDGGSGIVIIRYLTPSTQAITDPSSCDWNVAEIMVYDDNLTYAQENTIVEHLKTKYLPNANNNYLTDNRFSNTGGDIMDLYTPVAGSGSNLIYSHIQAGAGGLNGMGGAQGVSNASSYHETHHYHTAFNGSLNTPISPGSGAAHDSWHIDIPNYGYPPHWLSFEFPYDVNITSYKIWSRIGYGSNTNNNQSPKSWELRGVKHNVSYDQNVSTTYTVLDARTNQTTWTAGTVSSITNDSERNEYYTINKSLQAGAGGLNGTGGAQGVSNASSYHSKHHYHTAFNGSLNTPISPGTNTNHDSWHIAALSQGYPPHWLSFEFPYDVNITSYKIWSRVGFGSNTGNNQSPKSWELRGVKHNVSYDQNVSTTYTVLDARTNQTTWTAGTVSSITNDSERNEYNFSNSEPYRKYILHITDSNHASFLSIGEFALYGTYAGNTLDAFRKYILHITDSNHADWLSIGEFALCGIKKSNNSSVLRLPYSSSELPINKHGNYTNYSALNAFDSNYNHWTKNWSSVDNKYSINTGLPTSSPEWLSYEFTEATYVSHYNLATRNYKSGDTVPVSWDIQGSINTTNGVDGDWQLLTTEKNIVTGWKVGKFNKGFKISNPGKYKTYKFSVNRIADLIGAHQTHGNNTLFVGSNATTTNVDQHTKLRYTHATIGKLIYYSDEIINRVHIFKESNNFNLNYDGTTDVSFLIVGGGGGGGMDMGGGGGGGGVVVGTKSFKKGSYPVTVGSGGRGAPAGNNYGQPAAHQFVIPGYNGNNSVFCGFVGIGGGAGGSSSRHHLTQESAGSYGGSGGGESGYDATSARDGGKAKQNTYSHIVGVDGYGNDGGDAQSSHYPSGGGGAGSAGRDGNVNGAHGGIGKDVNILGFNILWGGGGGGSSYSNRSGYGSTAPDINISTYSTEKYGMHTGGGGGGGGGPGIENGDSYGAPGFNDGLCGIYGDINSHCNKPGGDAGKNTGGGGGGGSHYKLYNEGGNGGSGIVIIKYKLRNTSHTSISNNISRGFPPELPLHNNIIGWYTPESYDGAETWSDNSPHCNDIVVSRDDYKYLNTNNNLKIVTDTHNPGISYVKGTSKTKLDFPKTILPDGSYTLFHVARKPKDGKTNYGRIFDSKTNYNFYSGFDKLNSGVALHSYLDTSYSLPQTLRSNVNIQPTHLFTFYENLNDITPNDVIPAVFTARGNISHSKNNGLKISSGCISTTLGTLGIHGHNDRTGWEDTLTDRNSWTLSFWLKVPFRSAGGGSTIIGVGTQTDNKGLHINIDPKTNTESARMRFAFFNNDLDILLSTTPTNIETILQTEFVHFVLIYDYGGTYNEGQYRKIAYINGKRPVLKANGSNTHNKWEGNYDDTFYINASNNEYQFNHGNTSHWKNFAVFDRVLTQEEVEIIYNQGEYFSYYDNPVTETPVDATNKDYQNNWVISVDKWNSYRSVGYQITDSSGISEPTTITGPHAYDGSGTFTTQGDISSNYYDASYLATNIFANKIDNFKAKYDGYRNGNIVGGQDSVKLDVLFPSKKRISQYKISSHPNNVPAVQTPQFSSDNTINTSHESSNFWTNHTSGWQLWSSSGASSRWKAFDHSDTTTWNTDSDNVQSLPHTHWIAIQYPFPVKLLYYTHDNRMTTHTAQYIYNWKIYGSNDTTNGTNGTWYELDRVQNNNDKPVVRNHVYIHNLSNPPTTKYRTFKLSIISNYYPNGMYLSSYSYSILGNLTYYTALDHIDTTNMILENPCFKTYSTLNFDVTVNDGLNAGPQQVNSYITRPASNNMGNGISNIWDSTEGWQILYHTGWETDWYSKKLFSKGAGRPGGGEAFGGTNPSYGWIHDTQPTTPKPAWVVIKYPYPVNLQYYKYLNYTTTTVNRYMTDWTVQGSNDTSDGLNGTWTILDSKTDQTAAQNTTYTHTLSNHTSQNFMYFKLNVTDNGGGADLIVDEWYLYTKLRPYHPPTKFCLYGSNDTSINTSKLSNDSSFELIDSHNITWNKSYDKTKKYIGTELGLNFWQHDGYFADNMHWTNFNDGTGVYPDTYNHKLFQEYSTPGGLPSASLYSGQTTGKPWYKILWTSNISDTYTRVWWGWFIPNYTGVLYFSTRSDDTSLVYVSEYYFEKPTFDGEVASNKPHVKLVVNNHGLHGALDKYGSVNVIKDKPYFIKIFFAENGGGDNMIFRWSDDSALIDANSIYSSQDYVMLDGSQSNKVIFYTDIVETTTNIGLQTYKFNITNPKEYKYYRFDILQKYISDSSNNDSSNVTITNIELLEGGQFPLIGNGSLDGRSDLSGGIALHGDVSGIIGHSDGSMVFNVFNNEDTIYKSPDGTFDTSGNLVAGKEFAVKFQLPSKKKILKYEIKNSNITSATLRGCDNSNQYDRNNTSTYELLDEFSVPMINQNKNTYINPELMYPPTRNLASASHTISGQAYGNGTYDTSQSDVYDAKHAYSAFNTSMNSRPHFNSRYNSSGNYNTYNDKHLVDGYYGDWITIKLPFQINLTRYGFAQRPSYATRAPGQYKIYGSNDGINWIELVHKTSTITYFDSQFRESISTMGSYNYFGLVVNKLQGNANILNFDEWYIYGKEYDLMYPPTRNLTSASHTISGQTYGNGIYDTSQSDVYDATHAYSAFNTSMNSRPSFNSTYTSGSYNGSKNLQTGYDGDWLTIKLPVQINLTKYGFKKRVNYANRAPGQYKIYGSNNGSDWNVLVHKNSNIQYTVNDFEESISKIGMYNYFGLVVNKLSGSDSYLNFDEWYIYGREDNPELMYPPTRNLASVSHKISHQSYGNGIYVTNQSETYDATRHGYSAFNRSINGGPHFNSRYNSSGNYNTHNDKHLVDGYYGDWITIKLPFQINLTRYGFAQRASYATRAPGQYKIYGSNDGINWSELVHKTSIITYTGLYFQESISTTGTYNYFGLVVNKLQGNNTTLNFDEWYIYGRETYYHDKNNSIVSNPNDYSYYVLDISSTSDSSYSKIGNLIYYDTGTYPAAGAGGLDGSPTDIGGLLLHGDASGINGIIDSYPQYAFNNTISDYDDAFISFDASCSLKFEFPTSKIITKYKIWSQYNNKNNTPKEWTLRGCDISSNYIKTNSSTYTLLDSQMKQFPSKWSIDSLYNNKINTFPEKNPYYIAKRAGGVNYIEIVASDFHDTGDRYLSNTPHYGQGHTHTWTNINSRLTEYNGYHALDLNANQIQRVGSDTSPTLNKYVTQIYWVWWRENDSGWRTLFRGNNDHWIMIYSGHKRIGFYSNRNGNWRPASEGYISTNDVTAPEITLYKWQFIAAVSIGNSSNPSVGKTFYYIGTLGDDNLAEVGYADRVPNGTYLYRLGWETNQGPGYVAYAGVWSGVDEKNALSFDELNELYKQGIPRAGKRKDTHQTKENSHSNEYVVQNPGSYKNYILEIDKSNHNASCAIGQVAYYESNFIDISLSREPAPYLQHNLTVNNGVSNQNSDWEIGEIIVYDKELNVGEENKIVKHLKQTYCGNHNENFAIGNNNNKNISMNNVKLSVVGSMLNSDKNVQSFNHSTYTRLSDLSNVININNSTIKLVAGCGALSGTGGLDGSCNASSIYSNDYLAKVAFNNSILSNSDCWHSAESGGDDFTFTPQWLSFTFPNEQKYIVKYRLWPRFYDDTPPSDGGVLANNWRPSNWELHGVNNKDLSYNTDDSSTYTIIDIQSLPRYSVEEWNQIQSTDDTGNYAWKKQELNINFPDEPYYNEYFVENPGYYDEYVLKFTNIFNWSSPNTSYVNISQVAYYEQTDVIDISNTTVKLGDSALAMGGQIINNYSA